MTPPDSDQQETDPEIFIESVREGMDEIVYLIEQNLTLISQYLDLPLDDIKELYLIFNAIKRSVEGFYTDNPEFCNFDISYSYHFMVERIYQKNTIIVLTQKAEDTVIVSISYHSKRTGTITFFTDQRIAEIQTDHKIKKFLTPLPLHESVSIEYQNHTLFINYIPEVKLN